jgi:hypothetical protein
MGFTKYQPYFVLAYSNISTCIKKPWKFTRFSITLFVLKMNKYTTSILIVLLVASHYCTAQLTYDKLWVDYDSAWTYKNLKLIPIRYKGPAKPAAPVDNMISLSQALAQGKATIQERGTTAVENVHWLSLVNNSNNNIYISSGEVMAGGRQDRMVAKDTVIPANSGRVDLPVMCVEEGRWSPKDKKFTYQRMANMRLRKVLDATHSQVQVWRDINTQLDSSHIKSKNLTYLARNLDKKFIAVQNDYLNFFLNKFQQSDSTIVGVVCLSGDKIIGSDVFLTTDLFYGSLNALLLGYIEEAIVYGRAPITKADATVKTYLDQFLKTEPQQEAFIKKINGKLYKIKNKVIHITTY